MAIEAKYGLPQEVVFCKRCVMSNQRPASTPEFGHTTGIKHKTLFIQKDGICDACHYADQKENISWEVREKELIKLLDKYRRNDGGYDCLVPGSGGKDSGYASYLLKYKYGMHPLTVTWPPILYTDIGWQNYRNWIEVGGVDNVTFKPNGRVIKLLTKLSIENLFHPFQTFILGQKNLAPKMAINYGIPLIFYGENEAEYGNPIADNASSLRDKSYYVSNNLSQLYLGGVSVPELIDKYKLQLNDLTPFLPADYKDIERSKVEVHYLGYYVKWTPQEAYYASVERNGFKANPERTEGTYSKYNSLDDRIDGLHYYTTYIKFGLGRASYDAAQEIRNKHLNREEGVALVKRFDGEFPKKYFNEIMDYLGITEEKFFELEERARSPHLWEKADGKWRLRHWVGEPDPLRS
jgi:N-acetyl sugar amidotransferase